MLRLRNCPRMEFTPAQLSCCSQAQGRGLGQRNHNGVHPSAQLAFTTEKDDCSRTEGHCCCRRAPTGFGSYYDPGKPARSVPPNSWRLWIRRLQLLSSPALPMPAACSAVHAFMLAVAERTGSTGMAVRVCFVQAKYLPSLGAKEKLVSRYMVLAWSQNIIYLRVIIIH